MAKSRRKSILKKLKSASATALPIVDKGLKNVGIVAKDVAVKSVPLVEKGVAGIYGTMATGFNLGVKGARSLTSSSKKKSKKSRKGGRKMTRKH